MVDLRSYYLLELRQLRIFLPLDGCLSCIILQNLEFVIVCTLFIKNVMDLSLFSMVKYNLPDCKIIFGSNSSYKALESVGI